METVQQITWMGVWRGLAVVAGGVVVAFVMAWLMVWVMRARGRGTSSRRVLSRVLFWIIVAVALAAGLTLVFPSINPVDILGGLGVISIAAGIAFQTVLGNMFAGIVILSRDQYRVGDQVHVGDNAGTITAIHLSSTTIRRFDGQLVIIPNTVMHSSQVVVQTGFEHTRSEVTIELANTADLTQAKAVAERAMNNLDLVLFDPAPRALLKSIDAGSVTLQLLFWSGSRRLETREATDIIISTVIEAFRAEGVPLASTSIEVTLKADAGHSPVENF